MVQSTLDAFVRAPAPTPTIPDNRILDAMQDVMHKTGLALAPEIEAARDAAEEAEKEASKGVPRLHVAGVSTVLKTVAEAQKHVCEDGAIFLVTLSWRHSDPCGANGVIVAKEVRGAAFDRRPPPKPKKGELKELPSTLSPDELVGLVDMGEEVAEMLVSDERVHVVVMDGYSKGESYARLLAGIAARCIKLRRAGKDVALPRATAPADATCKAVLAAFKKCRSVEHMRKVAVDYYDEHLADRFP
tara:strand:+ start:55 stop:789 length:735 start_codon:yes stop_codon:yes gene_type:complete